MFEISSLRFAGGSAAADQLITVRPLTHPQQIRSRQIRSQDQSIIK